jgi:hypothetical protein
VLNFDEVIFDVDADVLNFCRRRRFFFGVPNRRGTTADRICSSDHA